MRLARISVGYPWDIRRRRQYLTPFPPHFQPLLIVAQIWQGGKPAAISRARYGAAGHHSGLRIPAVRFYPLKRSGQASGWLL